MVTIKDENEGPIHDLLTPSGRIYAKQLHTEAIQKVPPFIYLIEPINPIKCVCIIYSCVRVSVICAKKYNDFKS